ncbi:DM13 domain-containing protein [Streptomyces sp. NRRL B-24484]|uniref:DM13 domain-containing protein n=1 Tax=Streptomyces sp. NRRL B-24484 TaxID=1463833 RepID=UPI0005B7D5F9|nr:DM13 domain-containing protein [Streptomyces sp. NRRL B-24484]
MKFRAPLRRRPARRVTVSLAVPVLVAAGFGLYLFAPWKAFTSTAVDEALPSAPASRAAASAASMAPAAPAAPVDLARGGFVSGEHPTTGTARLVRLPDGTVVLRLEGLRTSDGPDVRVYLSALPAAQSRLDSLGEGAVELDRLKGNLGNQNYTVPAGTDLDRVRSAVIWCHRFSVGFGAADLART